ncbi:MAG: hypothetical protein KME33_13315 [Aetokthonos hydrillicola CCALA 1050]|nr:hypothetical protein [Aetokthonos hydrillicola CCALA 1050]
MDLVTASALQLRLWLRVVQTDRTEGGKVVNLKCGKRSQILHDHLSHP